MKEVALITCRPDVADVWIKSNMGNPKDYSYHDDVLWKIVNEQKSEQKPVEVTALDDLMLF